MKQYNTENFIRGLQYAFMQPIKSNVEIGTSQIPDEGESQSIIEELRHRITSKDLHVFAAQLYGSYLIVNTAELGGSLFHNFVKDSQAKEQNLIIGVIREEHDKKVLKYGYRIKQNKMTPLKPQEFDKMKKLMASIFS